MIYQPWTSNWLAECKTGNRRPSPVENSIMLLDFYCKENECKPLLHASRLRVFQFKFDYKWLLSAATVCATHSVWLDTRNFSGPNDSNKIDKLCN